MDLYFTFNLIINFQKIIQTSNLPQHLAKLRKVQSSVPILVSKNNHLGYLPVGYLFPQTGEHVLEFGKAYSRGLFVENEVFEDALTFLSRILYSLIFPLEELNELILLKLSSSVSVDLVHEILGLLLIDLHLACLEHLHYLILGDTPRIVSIEFHEDPQVLFFCPSFHLRVSTHRTYYSKQNIELFISPQIRIHSFTSTLHSYIIRLSLLVNLTVLGWVRVGLYDGVGDDIIGRNILLVYIILRWGIVVVIRIVIYDILTLHLHMVVIVSVLALAFIVQVWLPIISKTADWPFKTFQPPSYPGSKSEGQSQAQYEYNCYHIIFIKNQKIMKATNQGINQFYFLGAYWLMSARFIKAAQQLQN